MLFASAGEITCSSFSVGNRAAAFSPSFVISIPVDRMYFASGRSLSQFVTTYNVSLGMTSGRRASSPAHARTTLFAVQTHLATTPASHRVHHEEMSVRKHPDGLQSSIRRGRRRKAEWTTRASSSVQRHRCLRAWWTGVNDERILTRKCTRIDGPRLLQQR